MAKFAGGVVDTGGKFATGVVPNSSVTFRMRKDPDLDPYPYL